MVRLSCLHLELSAWPKPGLSWWKPINNGSQAAQVCFQPLSWVSNSGRQKGLENLSPLRIHCCKAASQLPRGVGQELFLLPAYIKHRRKNTRLHLASVGFSVLELMTVITQKEESDVAYLVLQSKNLGKGFWLLPCYLKRNFKACSPFYCNSQFKILLLMDLYDFQHVLTSCGQGFLSQLRIVFRTYFSF